MYEVYIPRLIGEARTWIKVEIFHSTITVKYGTYIRADWNLYKVVCNARIPFSVCRSIVTVKNGAYIKADYNIFKVIYQTGFFKV